MDEVRDDITNDLIQNSYAVETAGMECTELIALFTRNLEEAGGEVQTFTSNAALHHWLLEFVKTNAVTSAILSSEDYLKNLHIADALKSEASLHAVQMLQQKDFDYRSYTERTQLGIGLAHAGIAESGAVIIASTPHESRSMSLLVETHIAILDAKNLWKRLHQAAPMIDDLLLNHNISAITIVAGPSKTADIEKVLITGVHGPKRFIVCIMNRE